MRGFERELAIRRQLIDMRASDKRLFGGKVLVFHPRSSRDVLSNCEFMAGASMLTDMPALAPLVELVVADAEAKTGRRDARSAFMIGLAKDIRNAPPEEAAQYYAEAARMLGAERSGFFDPRRRGTVIESRGEIIRELAIRLLALGREADAFAAFESVRARGLGELALAIARPDVGAQDRRWLADLLVIEAQSSAIEHRIVADIVASGRLDAQADRLQALERLRAQRQATLKANGAARARFDVREITPSVTLGALEAASASAKVPVLLYWTTDANVIAWYVGPDGSDVRTVFLPERVLEEKVRNVLNSSGGGFGRTPFDETTARELFLYLLGPFSARLNAASVHEIVIVPQGALAGLPFEALIDPNSGASVIDRWAVSYAPNATMAVAALERQARPIRSVAALIDPTIDVVTGETTKIRASGVDLETMSRSELFAGSWRSDSLHVLTHGEKSLVRIDISSAARIGRSAGRVGASREIYGFPWALMAGGAEATVLSRWDVNGESNGKWMGVFYREVAAGSPVPLAAAAAMREMRKSGLTHPYYWAAMQASGR